MPETIIVSIDFGTTFSGAAWAITKRPEEIHVITDWDSEYNTCSDRGKCPTQLEHGTISDDTRWGYNIPADKDVVRWFKLLLLDESDVPKEFSKSSHVKQAINHQKRLKKSAVDLVACFLRSLWSHCVRRINDILGPGEVDSCKIHIIMTVPAIWPHYVQSRMRKAASLAGMLQDRNTSADTKTPTLDFVSEPEAAALAVLAEMHPRPDIKEKDTIIVCDAGGGTADLISYQVANVNSFQLRECVAGEAWGVWKKLDSADKRKFMKEDWENGIKSQFSGNSRPFFVEAPDGYLPDSAMGKRKKFQTISLSQGDLLGVFSPVVDKICALVHRQEAAIEENDLPSPKFIILVGGFGCCRYLRKRLADSYPNSTVLNPSANQSWTAVCRGAVRHALAHKALIKNGSHNLIGKAGKAGNFTIQSRILRMSYGFRYHEVFDPAVHTEEDKIWSTYDEEYRAENQMNWFLKQGQSVNSSYRSTHEYYRTVPADVNPSIEEDLHFCTLTDLPTRQTADVKTLCSIKWSQDVDLSKLSREYTSVAEAYHIIRYKIQVNVNGPELKITIMHGRKKVADHEVRIEYK